MKKYVNGKYIEMTPEEIAQAQAQSEQAEKEHWQNVDYDIAVENEIAKKYTIGQELAIQRQKDEKPEEYAQYYEYCESCKKYVKEQKQKYKN